MYSLKMDQHQREFDPGYGRAKITATSCRKREYISCMQNVCLLAPIDKRNNRQDPGR